MKTPFGKLRLEAQAMYQWGVGNDLGYEVFVQYLKVNGWLVEEYEAAMLQYIDDNWEPKESRND